MDKTRYKLFPIGDVPAQSIVFYTGPKYTSSPIEVVDMILLCPKCIEKYKPMLYRKLREKIGCDTRGCLNTASYHVCTV